MDKEKQEKEVMEYVLSTYGGQKTTWEEKKIIEFTIRAIMHHYDLVERKKGK